MSSSLTIVSRTSTLAMWQAQFVRNQLLLHHPELDIKIKGIKTEGDKWLQAPLYEIGGKSLFVKELEEALLSGEADLAVHCLKDMPAVLPERLYLGAILKRDDPFDAWICPKQATLATIPSQSVVGTSSLRRITQLQMIRPDLTYIPMRGNIDSRLLRCQAGEVDAIVLATAGLNRLNLMRHVTAVFTQEEMLPAVAQGALGIECREDDEKIRTLMTCLHHSPTAICIHAERAMNKALGGNCKVAIAGFAQLAGDKLTLHGKVACPHTLTILTANASHDTFNEPEELGLHVANALIQQGALEIIAKMNPM